MIHMKLVLLILILAVVLQFLELRRFRITTYEITSKKKFNKDLFTNGDLIFIRASR